MSVKAPESESFICLLLVALILDYATDSFLEYSKLLARRSESVQK